MCPDHADGQGGWANVLVKVLLDLRCCSRHTDQKQRHTVLRPPQGHASNEWM